MNIRVKIPQNSYDIIIGRDIFSKFGAYLKNLRGLGRDAVVITNAYVHKTHGEPLKTSLQKYGFSVKVFTVADSERSKSAPTAITLLNKIAAYDVRKQLFIIAFGGGVVGDLAGFVAAVYKRGIPYVQVPTTLLAQIDSAIGGKVAVDLPVGKNLVGAFYQPKMVFSDVALLATLSEHQIRNGLAEAVKYGMIWDKKLFQYIEARSRALINRDARSLERVVLESSRIKARVVSLDEKETMGLRLILNFGHTIGHAIETAGGYKAYHHGEAIALGMRVAARMACALNLFSRAEADRLEKLLSAIGLPRQITRVSLSKTLSAMAHDKKFKAGQNRFILPTTIGKVKIVAAVDRRLIEESIRAYMVS